MSRGPEGYRETPLDVEYVPLCTEIASLTSFKGPSANVNGVVSGISLPLPLPSDRWSVRESNQFSTSFGTVRQNREVPSEAGCSVFGTEIASLNSFKYTGDKPNNIIIHFLA